MHKIRKYLIFQVVLFTSCIANQDSKITKVIDYYSGGKIENLVLKTPNGRSLFMNFDSQGFLRQTKFLSEKNRYEVLFYHPNGNLEAKSYFDNKSDEKMGKSYDFYESGILKSEGNWWKNISVGDAFYYYDSSGKVSLLLKYDSLGNLYSKRYVSEEGVIRKSE
jgi:antitoxin component YwqK of YwqJK toxin-antitoxin module